MLSLCIEFADVMETLQLKNTLKVIYIEAESFPDGVEQAFKTLKAKVSDHEIRPLFGISRPDESGKIIYKAALKENYEGEGAQLGCSTMEIKAGPYLCETLKNWQQQKMQIGRAFMKLLADPRRDDNTYCYEWYNNDDMICMILLKAETITDTIKELSL